MYRDDVAQLAQTLAGLSYPANKWKLIAHSERDRASHGPTELRTIHQLWALPPGRYTNLAQVLAAAARTSRGHPRRSPTTPDTHTAPLTD